MEYTNSQIRGIIEDTIHSERDRIILCRRFIDGVTYERLAEEFDLSVMQIKRIIYQAEKTLCKHLHEPN